MKACASESPKTTDSHGRGHIYNLHTVAVTERGREEVQAVRRRDVGGRGVLDQRAGPNIHSTGRRELTEFVKRKEETKVHPPALGTSVLKQRP